tara:strand:+ start:1731 stop:3419 length:1689 start_codon:yes stop_codon:yes gene_type:complete
MKLLIILTLLSLVNCGINNSITVFNNNTIYLANTNNAVIYKLTKNTNTYEKKVVIGNERILGNVSDYNGLEARLKNPRSIINDFDKRVLFFIDNDHKSIKRSTINNPNNKGIEISSIVKETSFSNIYEILANNYAGYKDDKYLFFVSSSNLHKINLTNEQDDTDININNMSSNLDSGSNFINISYYNNSLFYCYKNTTDTFYFKKSSNEHNFNINENISLNINYTEYLQHIKGFTFIEHNTCNLLLVTGTSNSDTKICKFNYIDNNTINYIISYSTDIKYSTLIDYKAIYGSDADYNGFIIGRTHGNRNGFNKIKITGNNSNLNEENETVINMLQGGNININTTNSTIGDIGKYLINTNIIYNNIINTNNADNDYRIIHFNENQSKINLIKYSKANFSTYKMKFDIDDTNTNIDNFSEFNNNIIQNITITQNNILYIALYNETTDKSKIYTCSNPINNLTITNITNLNSVQLEEETELNKNINGKISAMNYLLSENNTDELHYITNESYNKYNINNKTNIILENIKKTNNTDGLDKINDFIIDTDYEIGYIAFETRLKWFYY